MLARMVEEHPLDRENLDRQSSTLTVSGQEDECGGGLQRSVDNLLSLEYSNEYRCGLSYSKLRHLTKNSWSSQNLPFLFNMFVVSH